MHVHGFKNDSFGRGIAVNNYLVGCNVKYHFIVFINHLFVQFVRFIDIEITERTLDHQISKIVLGYTGKYDTIGQNSFDITRYTASCLDAYDNIYIEMTQFFQ